MPQQKRSRDAEPSEQSAPRGHALRSEDSASRLTIPVTEDEAEQQKSRQIVQEMGRHRHADPLEDQHRNCEEDTLPDADLRASYRKNY